MARVLFFLALLVAAASGFVAPKAARKWFCYIMVLVPTREI